MSEKRDNGDFRQVIFNIVIIGVFSIAKEWVAAQGNGSWLISIIFTFLTMLMFCLLAINIYNCLIPGREQEASNNDRQIQALLYKQIKRLEGQMAELIAKNSDGAFNREEQMFEDMKTNQLRSAKAILKKIDEIQSRQDELMKLYEQTAAAIQLSGQTVSLENAEAEVKESLTEEVLSGEPTLEEPAPEESVSEEPVQDESALGESVSEEPVLEEPALEEPVLEGSEETVLEEALIQEEPLMIEPIAEGLILDESLMEEPMPEEFVLDESIMDSSATGGMLLNEAVLDDSAADDPLAALLAGDNNSNRELTPDEIAALFSGVD